MSSSFQTTGIVQTEKGLSYLSEDSKSILENFHGWVSTKYGLENVNFITASADNNGIYELAYYDQNEDGTIDVYGIDKNEDDNFEIILIDTNNNGNPDEAEIDENEDGKTDVIAYDFNEDGEWDKFENV